MVNYKKTNSKNIQYQDCNKWQKIFKYCTPNVTNNNVNYLCGFPLNLPNQYFLDNFCTRSYLKKNYTGCWVTNAGRPEGFRTTC